jgi:structural maintenance of chromosome 4
MTPCAVWCPRSVITRKLKEMYQMITLGGDAELELVDSLDPFSEGIVFRCVGVEVVAEVVLLLWLLAGWVVVVVVRVVMVVAVVMMMMVAGATSHVCPPCCCSVRPPKKSWKNISNLSGGEKTLSSLALVFALHHYKVWPCSTQWHSARSAHCVMALHHEHHHQAIVCICVVCSRRRCM